MALRILFFLVSKRDFSQLAHAKKPGNAHQSNARLSCDAYSRYSTFFSFCTSFCRSSTIEDSLLSDRSAIGKVELI